MIALPFKPSIANYTFDTTIEDESYYFEVHWNSTDNDGVGAWYFDIYEVDGTSIELNIKAVIGTNLGRTSNHRLFQDGIIAVIDTSGAYEDPGFDDIGIGERVEIRYYTLDDVMHEIYAN